MAELIFNSATAVAIFGGLCVTVSFEIFETHRHTEILDRDHNGFCLAKMQAIDADLQDVRREMRDLYNQVSFRTLDSQFPASLAEESRLIQLFKEDPRSYELAVKRADLMFQKCAYTLCSQDHRNNPVLYYAKWCESSYRGDVITFLQNNPLNAQAEDRLLIEVVLRVMKRFIGSDDNFSVIEVPQTNFNSEGKIEE